jgi:hypothetical protein
MLPVAGQMCFAASREEDEMFRESEKQRIPIVVHGKGAMSMQLSSGIGRSQDRYAPCRVAE